MGLMECGACKGQVSSEAKACPTCGHPVPNPGNIVPWLVIVPLMLIGLVVAVWWAVVQPGKPTQERICSGEVPANIENLVAAGLSYAPEVELEDAARKMGLDGARMLTYSEKQRVLKGLARCGELK